MELNAIQALMHEFDNSHTRELRIDDGEFHLYLSKNKENTPQEVGNVPASAAPVEEETTPTPAATDTQTITAPLVGTVYLQPKPDAKPYVQVGDHVQVGDVVCVIEAMKMMTEIKSDVAGTIAQVNVGNEELVEVEQPLFTIAKEESHD